MKIAPEQSVKNLRVCGLHFPVDAFSNAQKNRLVSISNAIPDAMIDQNIITNIANIDFNAGKVIIIINLIFFY